MNDASPGGDGGWSRHWLPKREGTHAVGRTGGTLRPHPGVWNNPVRPQEDKPFRDMKDNPYGCNKLNSFVNHHRGCIRILLREII